MYKDLGAFTELSKALEFMDSLQEQGKNVRIDNLPVLGVTGLFWVYVLSEV